MKNKYIKQINKIILISLILLLMTQISSAALLTSSANPVKIFKCGESTIAATFDDGGVVSVNAIINPTGKVNPMVVGRAGQNTPEMAVSVNVSMSYNGTYWVGTFGDDSNLLWGTRSITYLVNGVTSYGSGSTVFVYNGGSSCSGTGKNSYTNYTTGIGFYTNKLVSGEIPIEKFWLYPWLQYWGYLFYILVMITMMVSIHMKTENVMAVLITMFAFLLIISGAGVIDLSYRSYVISLIALCLAAVCYRLFVRE